MFETGNSDKPLRDLEAPDEDVSVSSDCDYGLAGKRQFGKRRIRSQAGTKAGPQEGKSIVSALLQRRIVMRLDAETLDLSTEFCGKLIESLALFGDEIQKFCYDVRRTRKLLRCCIMCAVLEFYDWQYSKEVSEATTLLQSLIQNEGR